MRVPGLALERRCLWDLEAPRLVAPGPPHSQARAIFSFLHFRFCPPTSSLPLDPPASREDPCEDSKPPGNAASFPPRDLHPCRVHRDQGPGPALVWGQPDAPTEGWGPSLADRSGSGATWIPSGFVRTPSLAWVRLLEGSGERRCCPREVSDAAGLGWGGRGPR